MKAPRILFGMGPTVRKRVRKLVHGKPWVSPEPEWGELIDVTARPGSLLLLDHTDRSMPGEHFHIYSPFTEFFGARLRDVRNQWVDWLLTTAWGTAGFMGSNGSLWLYPPGPDVPDEYTLRRTGYLRAVLTHLDELDAVGPRFKLLPEVGVMSSLQRGHHYSILKEYGFTFSEYSARTLRAALTEHLERVQA